MHLKNAAQNTENKNRGEKKNHPLNIHWVIQPLCSLLTYDDDFGFYNKLPSLPVPFLLPLLALNENESVR